MATLLRAPKAFARCGVSKSQGYLLMQRGEFPKPVKLGPNSVAWLEHELDQWILDRAAERDQQSADSPRKPRRNGRQVGKNVGSSTRF